ncbi:SRPBCC family protein [Nocardia jinanensis]|uniref:Activator of HSP90 ATPase n=1 Tax=Nocardia jinanensis TaxID=382504 RepID=A0A917VXG9_9NOCA|nr:SRPBCC family protein [Nocardia jinanensis]GGL28670.1 activator of HSP90 ATPase [Nocardia jinanensis]
MGSLTDPAAIAGLVTREVRTGERQGAVTRIAVARRTYATDPDDLWEALTDIDRIPRWFLPVTGQLSVGGRYQTEGNAGGVIEECEPPKHFAVTWEAGPIVSWLEIRLTRADAGTTLELVHEAPVDPDMWKQFGPGAVGVGWDLALLGLGLHLDSRAEDHSAAAVEFPLTPAGNSFVRAAAGDWAEAAISDGDDPAQAHTAAEATVGFYTAEEEQQS